ncbi:TfdA family taurine dioxygenase [Mycena sanguinolenta]|nr:TfdA family taurine dioxygenase [Mycena sanguinolenta]
MVARRGVVFFHDQDITIEQQKSLARRMGELTGRPASSGLHKNPISPDCPELGENEVSVISSTGGISRAGIVDNTRASNGWHTDIPFEPFPADYSILKILIVPDVGGDTLLTYHSGYGAYDKLSPTFAKFLEGLTAMHSGQFFLPVAERMGLKIQDNWGHPENSGSQLTAIHSDRHHHKTCLTICRFTTRIMELSVEESDDILAYLARHISENHDLQARYGNRVVGIGEKPFFNPASEYFIVGCDVQVG